MMFLDDSENPNKFLDVIDSLNPSIMFKMEISDKELSVLDILIEKKRWQKMDRSLIWAYRLVDISISHCLCLI